MTTDHPFAYRGWRFICSVERTGDALYQPMFCIAMALRDWSRRPCRCTPSHTRPLPMHSGTPNNRRCTGFMIGGEKVGVGLTRRQNPCAI